jgi:AbiTii
MAKQHKSLLSQIEQEALDERQPLSGALRKCVSLGGLAGSSDLRDWATKELRGYSGDDELPSYRTVGAPIFVDAVKGNVQITGQQIGRMALPDFIRDNVDEKVELHRGIGEIEAMIRGANNGVVQLSLPSGADLATYMNYEAGDPFQHIVSIYWKVSTTALHGVIDQVRTGLVQLVAEIRATTLHEDDVPSAEAATQAVHLVVSGKRSRVTFTNAQASGQATASVAGDRTEPESGFWTRGRKIGAFLVGLATIIGAIAAIIAIL